MKGLSIALPGLLLGLALGGRLPPSQAVNGRAAVQGDPTVQTSRHGSVGAGEIEALKAELARRPDWTEGWWKLGTLAYDADRYDAAAAALTQVIAAAPQMGIAYDLLGLSEFELKQYDAARLHLDRAVQLGNADDPEVERVAVYHLGLLQVQAGDFDRSTALLLNKLGAAPNAQIAYVLGLAALHVPLLPNEVDPSQEAWIESVGNAVMQGKAGLPQFAELISQHPDEPWLQAAYGRALEQAGELSKALEVYGNVGAGAPGSVAAWLGIARIDHQQAHDAASRAAERKALTLEHVFAPASEQARVARYKMRSAPDSAEGWSDAMRAYASGEYRSAAQELTAWVGRHPEDGTAWAVLGLSEYALHQYDNALLHLQRGEALGLHGDPGAVETADYTAGVLLLRSGRFDAASEILASAHRLRPQDDRVTFALGSALLRRPGLPRVGTNDGLVTAAGQIELLLGESRYDEAFPAFRALLQKYPAVPFLHYAYGTALIALSEFDEAAAQMRDELQVNPNSPLPYTRLASIALRQHTPAEALSPARRAVTLDGSSAEPHYLLGRALLETGDETAAIRELEEARRLNPGSPEVHFSLARAYAKANREGEAAQERATFARLSELSEAQKSGASDQMYAGPRQAQSLSDASSHPAPQ